jgi:dienelactone hydrolase
MYRQLRVILGCLAALLVLPIAAVAQVHKILPVEDFTRDPAIDPPLVSPSGNQVAWVEDKTLFIYDRQTLTFSELQAQENQEFEVVSWASDNYLIVRYFIRKKDSIYKKYKIRNDIAFNAGYILINNKGKYIRPLFVDGSHKITEKYIIGIFDDKDPHVLFLKDIDITTFNIYKQNISENKEYAVRRKDKVHDFQFDEIIIDSAGVARVLIYIYKSDVNYGNDRVNYQYRPTPDSQWHDYVLDPKPNSVYTNYYYFEKEQALYWQIYNIKTDKTEVYRLEFATGATTLWNIFDGKEIELIGDPLNGGLVGIGSTKERTKIKWLDVSFEAIYSGLQKAFPNKSVWIVNYNRDRTVFTVGVSDPQLATTYYLYDTQTHKADIIGEVFPELIGQPLAPKKYITYKARDDLEIPAYLSIPPEIKKPAPLIVYVHGGPAGRDYYDFDPWVQFFANRGYVVLQPQYRGSSGFGDVFQKAGDKHLKEMNYDLQDGVKYLIDQGLVDPKKVCVVGWSWGGYLAQAAITFTPESYACAVSGAGVSDLRKDLDRNENSEYWQSVEGEISYQGKMIHDTSPIFFVDQIKAPLLLLHGEEDGNVNIEQSEMMNSAMLRAGKSVKFVKFPLEGHTIYGDDNRVTLFKEMDAFIADAFAKADNKPKPQN